MELEKRIRESSHGGYVVEWGKPVESQPNPGGIGYIMPCFFTYEMSRYDTLEEAEKAECEK